jgi:hypothetical protein
MTTSSFRSAHRAEYIDVGAATRAGRFVVEADQASPVGTIASPSTIEMIVSCTAAAYGDAALPRR